MRITMTKSDLWLVFLVMWLTDSYAMQDSFMVNGLFVQQLLTQAGDMSDLAGLANIQDDEIQHVNFKQDSNDGDGTYQAKLFNGDMLEASKGDGGYILCARIVTLKNGVTARIYVDRSYFSRLKNLYTMPEKATNV